jgi:hypothetical protein
VRCHRDHQLDNDLIEVAEVVRTTLADIRKRMSVIHVDGEVFTGKLDGVN